MSETFRFSVGDSVWYAHTMQSEEVVVCPDCQGKKHLRVIMGDDSEVTIDCSLCSPRGYEPSRGYVRTYKYQSVSSESTVSGMECNAGKTRYHLIDRYGLDDSDCYSFKELADARALELAAEYQAREAAELKRKEKDGRSWAWHVRYHRECAKRAMEEYKRHMEKLDAAKLHAKVSA